LEPEVTGNQNCRESIAAQLDGHLKETFPPIKLNQKKDDRRLHKGKGIVRIWVAERRTGPERLQWRSERRKAANWLRVAALAQGPGRPKRKYLRGRG